MDHGDSCPVLETSLLVLTPMWLGYCLLIPLVIVSFIMLALSRLLLALLLKIWMRVMGFGRVRRSCYSALGSREFLGS